MTLSKTVVCALSVCAAFFMTGCGGGGGTSSDGGSDLPSIEAPAAPATAENGQEAAGIVLGAEGFGSVGLLAASSDNGFDPLSFTLNMSKQINSLDFKSYSLNETYSDTIQCTDGGKISITSTSSASNGTATIIYDNCAESSMIMNGTITMTASGDFNNNALTSQKIKFSTDYIATYSGMTLTIHAGSYYQYDYTTYDWNNDLYAGMLTTSLWVEDGSYHFRYDDLIVQFEDDYWNNGTSVRCYKDGRIYINNLAAYLDIDTAYDPSCNDPFVWQYYQLQSGSMEFIGSDSSRAHVEADGTGGYVVTVN